MSSSAPSPSTNGTSSAGGPAPNNDDSNNNNNNNATTTTSSLAPPTRRPTAVHAFTSPAVSTMNGHLSAVGSTPSKESFEHGIQVIDEDKNFNKDNLPLYLQQEHVLRAGFNYHLISVFGSQSTGKSTLLNALFGTGFGVMSEQERRQTTKGIWMSKNKKEGQGEGGGNNNNNNNNNSSSSARMAENILVMDVEGTDGRERGEDQDFERKSALFALATSEVLIVNIWEHQVGLYQGANMGLLKTVFEVNLGLFLKSGTVPKSLLFFVIRDHVGNTPLSNLRQTLLADLARIWSTLSKPPGLENSKIEDYFDFAFVALPHKILQPEAFETAVQKLGTRFREGTKRKSDALVLDEQDEPLLFPEYHRRIPADGLSHYANGIWEQIESNKDLDLPTQQELLAQFRCDEIAREVLVAFDDVVAPFETKQSDASKSGAPVVILGLGKALNAARKKVLDDFKTEASRYHQGVYKRKGSDLESQVDSRLKALFKGQLSAAHKEGVQRFSEAVASAVKHGQKKGANYDFQSIVQGQQKKATEEFEKEAKSTVIEGASWSEYQQELNLFKKELDQVSAQLRKDELRRLATRVERWVRSHLGEAIGVQFNKLGSGRAGSGAPEFGDRGSIEKDLWDRIWHVFTEVISHAQSRFTERAKSLDASPEEVEVGIWRLKRKSWAVLRAKIDEEVMEGNLLLKLRENFEDKFRYDDEGVPRIWRPTDDIEGIYTKARESTLELIPLLSKFTLSETHDTPRLEEWIGSMPPSTTAADEEDLTPIGGVDEDEGKTLDEEMTVISDAKRQDLAQRFRKTADGVYVEAKRSAIGGVTQVPLYFYGLLLALGWNEIVTVLRNPVYFIFLLLMGVGAYVTYTLNLWGPIMRMTNAASAQGLDIFREKLREFLESSDTGRQAMAMSGGGLDGDNSYEMKSLGGRRSNGTATAAGGVRDDDEDEAVDEI